MNTPKRSFWSRPRGALLLGAAACAACCAAPLTALVIGAGAASTIGAIAEPVAGALFAVGALLGIAAYVRRRRGRVADTACAADGGCGCGSSALYESPDPIAHAPIACSVDLTQRNVVQAGIDEYRSVFAYLRSSERTATGLRWHFSNVSGLGARLTNLAAAEHRCCSFLKFTLTTDGDEIVWETNADERAQTFVDEYFRLPDRLREEPRKGHDLEHLRATSLQAGITFTAMLRGSLVER